MTAGSLAFKLCMFFTTNPGAVIYTDQIVERWMPGSDSSRSIFSQLEHTRRKGFINGVKKPGDARMYYEAGPELLKMIEEMT